MATPVRGALPPRDAQADPRGPILIAGDERAAFMGGADIEAPQIEHFHAPGALRLRLW